MGIADRLQEIIAPLCDDLGVELVDLEYTGGQVRVTVDREGGIDLALLSTANRRISRALDERDPIAGRYTLEVSSPGLERPLRTPTHFARAVGAKVRIKTRPDVEGERRIVGVLHTADEQGVTVEVEETGQRRSLDYDEIDKARTVFEWGPAPKPGGQRKKGQAKARGGRGRSGTQGAGGSKEKAVNA